MNEMTTEELEIWKRLNELECVKKVFGIGYMGRDIAYCQRRKEPVSGEVCVMCPISSSIFCRLCAEPAIWIPPLYDPIRPERSLIGIFMRLPGIKEPLLTTIGIALIYSYRPDLALAKAIIEQEVSDGAEICCHGR